MCINYHLCICLVGPTCIIYSEEHSDVVLELSDFLRNHCGVDCDIDQYHTRENITQWAVWHEDKIKKHARCNGFVLLVCSSKMYQQLNNPSKSSQIQMKPGHIGTLALNSLISEEETTPCIIPVCDGSLEKSNMVVPSSLRGRTIYCLSFSTLKQVNPEDDVEHILNTPGLESLRSLVFRLKGESEIVKAPLGRA